MRIPKRTSRGKSLLLGLSAILLILLLTRARSPILQPEVLHAKHDVSTCDRSTFEKRAESDVRDRVLPTWEQAKTYVLARHLTYLMQDALEFHRDKLNEIEMNGVEGMIFECGVAKAGSSISFTAVKHRDRCMHLFDTFEGMPKPSERDGADVLERYEAIQKSKRDCQEGSRDCDKNYYGNIDNLLGFVKQKFEDAGYPPDEHNVHFHKGLFDDTVWPNGPIAYAHLDGDWYDSTMSMLQRLSPHLSVGGYFVLDDVYAFSGAREAYKDFFNRVDLNWLKKQRGEKCVTVRDGKRYLLNLGVRASAKVLSSTATPSAKSCVST